MASPVLSAPDWRSPVEWLLLALLIAALLLVFGRYARQVQGQSELAAVKTTLGSLRTALVIDHLQRQLPVTPQGLPAARNPFELVKQSSVRYLGQLTAAQAAQAPAGSWFYVAACPCVGYRPQDELWLGSPSIDPTLWFAVTGWPGVPQLTPKENYFWRQEPVN